MKRIFTFLLIFIFLFNTSMGIEIIRQKSQATYIFFPMIDESGDLVTGCGSDTPVETYDAWADGTAPDGFSALTNGLTEIGTSGWYYISLTSGEMGNDYIAINVTVATSTTLDQNLLIRTMTGDPLNLATNSSGYPLDVTSTGAAGFDWGNIENPTTAQNLSATNFDVDQVVASVSGNVGGNVTGSVGSISGITFPTNFADLAITASTGLVDINDKTGFGLSGTQTFNNTGTWTGNLTGSVGSISGVTFPTNFGDLSITASTGLVDLNDKTGMSLAAGGLNGVTQTSGGVLISGTKTTLDDLNDLDSATVEGAGEDAISNAALSTDSLIVLMNNAYRILGAVCDCEDTLRQVYYPLDSSSPKDSVRVFCKATDSDSTYLFTKYYGEGSGGKVDYIWATK